MLAKSALLNQLPQLRLRAGLLRQRRSEHQLAHSSRMTDRDLQRDARAVAEAEDVRLLRHEAASSSAATSSADVLKRHRRVAVARAAVRLLFDSDDAAVARKERHDAAERRRRSSSRRRASSTSGTPRAGPYVS